MQPANIEHRIKLGIRGKIRLVAHRGSILLWDTGWEHNELTRWGMNTFPTTNFVFDACVVGDDNTPNTPSGLGFVENTALGNQLAMRDYNGKITISQAVSNVSPYESHIQWRWRFGPGFVASAQTLREVGFHQRVDTTLTMRKVVPDLPVDQNTTLDVYYQSEILPPLGDVTATYNIADAAYPGGQDRLFTLRAATAGAPAGYWSWVGYWIRMNTGQFRACYDTSGQCVLGPVTGGLTRSGEYNVGESYIRDQAYVTDSFRIFTQFDIAEVHGNPNLFDYGISGYKIHMSPGDLQMTISPPIKKDNTQKLTQTVGLSWTAV